MPPPVEPAQAPTNISTTRMDLEKVGQRSKSTVPKPVVVIMEETWKKAWRRPVHTLPYMWQISAVIAATAAATTSRYARSSSDRNTSRNRRINKK